MKKRFSSLIIYTFLLISFTFVTANIRDGAASFPAVAQEHNNWCWAGSSQAMLYYYGTSVSQCDIANWASSRSDCCGNTDFYWDHPCNQARGMYGSDGSHQAIMSHWGVDSISHAYALSSSTVISEIDANRPFVIRFGLTFGGGHFLDGYGYGYTSESNPKQYIYYMNPWPGQGYTMTLYSTVVSAWDHTWTHSLQGSATTGCTTYSGTLSTAQAEQQPNGTYYLSTASGTHKGILTGPSGTDFDLRLYKWNGTDRYWYVVGSGITYSSNETVSVYGSAGYYTWVVNAYSGSGSYSLCISHP